MVWEFFGATMGLWGASGRLEKASWGFGDLLGGLEGSERVILEILGFVGAP